MLLPTKKNILRGKIDFLLFITVAGANPNGDPLNGNRPRDTIDGYGEISDVCIKRKIRNRLQDMGLPIFVQSADRCDDGCDSLQARTYANAALKTALDDKNEALAKKIACDSWIDVRSFGQMLAFRGSSDSIGIRGPVTIQTAISADPVEITEMQIVKSVNGEAGAKKKTSDTMGSKYRVTFGLYAVRGSINVQPAELTGFTDDDAEKIKEALMTLFANDASSARPDGTMETCRLYWWQHNSKLPKYSSAQVQRSVKVTLKDPNNAPTRFDDYDISVDPSLGLIPDVYDLT